MGPFACGLHSKTSQRLCLRADIHSTKPTNTAGRVIARLKVEGILYHQGTQVVEKGFTPTWVGALQLIALDGHLSGCHLTYFYMDSESFYNSIAVLKAKVSMIMVF